MSSPKKNVLVTGATRGLGFAIAVRLAEEGYQVIGTGRKLAGDLARHLEASPASRGGIRFEPLDLGDVGGLHGFVARVVKSYGGLYGLVNNAAIAHEGILATFHDSQIVELVTVNLASTMILTKYAVRPMLLAGSGRVVNISSVAALTGFNGLTAYSATKAGLIGFTRSLARELGRVKITVNAVAPGYMQTEMSAGLSPRQLESITRRTALGRLVGVEEVASAVSFLLGEGASGITGTVLTVDAGSTA